MQKNCLYTYFLKYRIVWKWACSNTLNYHLIHVRDCTKTSKLKSITELKSAEKQRSESMKGNMEFQRHIELINGTSSNDSFTEKLQNYCSQKYLKVKSRISHKRNLQNQAGMKLKPKIYCRTIARNVILRTLCQTF